jgi:GTP 3',8-cyclase
MLDHYNRNITYLRISVTDRCNLRCVYCMPAEGIKRLPHDKILRFSEIVEVVKIAVENGVNKIRITGGEPLVRKDIVSLVGMIAKVEGINDLAMTTNGQLLEKYAKQLAEAGLNRVNVSLDTINPDKYAEVTRGGDIKNVFQGLLAAQKEGLTPIKLNCVVSKSHNEPDAIAVKEFGEQMAYQVRFIHQMDLETGYFTVVEGGEGGNCAKCNRIRLTANGKLMPCLFSDLAYDVRELGAKEAFNQAVKNKPERGGVSHEHCFYNIGG